MEAKKRAQITFFQVMMVLAIVVFVGACIFVWKTWNNDTGIGAWLKHAYTCMRFGGCIA